MKKLLLTTVAALTVISAPVLAQGYDPEGDIGQTGIYFAPNEAAAPMSAFASGAHEKQAPQVKVPAYNVEGNKAGFDPDPNVRLELRRDEVQDW